MAFNWTASAIKGAGLWDQLDRLDDIGGYVESELDTLRGEVASGSQFTPFTVAGQWGQAGVDQSGNLTLAGTPQEQAMAQDRATQSNMFYDLAADPEGIAGISQGVYDDLRAMQMPEEQRAMSSQEQRLFAQGRGGMTTNQYGGAPEQLALQKAIGENRNAAAASAWQFGQQQQAQNAALGSQYQTAQYMPQAQMLNTLNPALQANQLVQAGQLAGSNLGAQLGLGQITSQVNTEKVRAELLGNLFNDVSAGVATSGADPVGSIFGKIFEQFGF
jgi:hypothetical protein